MDEGTWIFTLASVGDVTLHALLPSHFNKTIKPTDLCGSGDPKTTIRSNGSLGGLGKAVKLVVMVYHNVRMQREIS